jgi:hypothetical protein
VFDIEWYGLNRKFEKNYFLRQGRYYHSYGSEQLANKLAFFDHKGKFSGLLPKNRDLIPNVAREDWTNDRVENSQYDHVFREIQLTVAKMCVSIEDLF